MMKSIFLSIIILPFFLQPCNGQHKEADVQNKNAQTAIDKGHILTQSTFTAIPATNVNNQINQVVRTVFQDSKGNIWFGTENGAFKFANKSLTHIGSIKSESGKGVTIKDICEDNDGTIWFGHTDGISSLKGETVINYYESDGLLSNDVWSISSDAEGKIWSFVSTHELNARQGYFLH